MSKKTPNKSDLELRAERINYEGDLSLYNLKRFYDRSPIAEKYAEGHASLQFHVGSARPYAFECFSRSAGSAEVKATPAFMSNEFPVFVWVGNITQGFRPVESFIRLVSLDSVYVRVRKVSEWPLAFQSRFPMFDEFILDSDRELCAIRIGQTGVQFRQLVDDVIESSAKIMNAIADDQSQFIRSRSLRRKDEIGLIPNLVILDANVIRLARGIGINEVHEVPEMLIGAFDPFTSAVQGVV